MNPNEFPPKPGSSNPYGTQPAGTPFTIQPSTPSVLGIVSMIAGVISPFLCCLCYLSTFSSLAAVITGHLSLAEINRSSGKVTGKAFAIIGLAFGYPMLLLSLAFIGLAVYSSITGDFDIDEAEIASSMSSSSGTEALHNAEMKILGDSQGTAHGNTKEAEVLAAEFSKQMKTLREALFTEDDREIQITGGEFLTYCELHDDHALFLVHVPAYRDFGDDAKEELAALAWTTAQSVVEDTLFEGDRLAVGMKGTILYGAVMVGTVGSDEPNSTSKEKDRLVDFFPNKFEFEYGIQFDADDDSEPNESNDDF